MEQLQGYSQQSLAASGGLNTHSGVGAHRYGHQGYSVCAKGPMTLAKMGQQPAVPNAGQGDGHYPDQHWVHCLWPAAAQLTVVPKQCTQSNVPNAGKGALLSRVLPGNAHR